MPDTCLTEPTWHVETAPAMTTERAVRTVLVVDDNPAVAETTADLLRHLGHEVEIAYDGNTAIEAAARLRPDVVLLDIGMPDMNGYQAAARLRADPRIRADLVIIGVTGWGTEGHAARACQSGFDKFWSKPLTLAELLSL